LLPSCLRCCSFFNLISIPYSGWCGTGPIMGVLTGAAGLLLAALVRLIAWWIEG